MQAETQIETQSEWLQRVESIPAEFKSWLIRQYHGEVRATNEIIKLADDLTNAMQGSNADVAPVVALLVHIANDEANHAKYIAALLDLYGYTPDEQEPNGKYWEQSMKGVQSFDDIFAVGAHAEAMRLSRIEAVMNSKVFDETVCKVFARIYEDEKNHVEWFRSLCSDEAFERMSEHHKDGLNALGLVL